MKKFLGVFIAMLLCFQVCGFAQTESAYQPEAEIAPRGVYLFNGYCGFNVDGRTIIASGETKCFETVDEVTITLILYRNNGGIWESVWQNSWSAYNASSVYSPKAYVTVSPGEYKLGAEYSCVYNGYFESGYSETGTTTIY